MNNSASYNLIKSLNNHEFDNSYNKTYISKNIFSKSLISRLNLDSELQGHEGCVNCLEWNQSGTLLASGSDDLKLIIWDPFKKKSLNIIDTKHRGNIFSVKFLPSTNDCLVASAAADRDIYVCDISKNLNINELHSHQNRVKKLATAQNEPFLFWSCGEDGLVLQHDIRCSTNKISNILLNYAKNEYNTNSNLEVKCIAINQVRSEMIGVGCNDPYARVYDRRMIKLRPYTSVGRNSQGYARNLPKCLFEYSIEKNDITNTPFNYYVPGHLPRKIDEFRKRMKTLSVTHLTFSSNGSELLLNLGGEQLYLFDILTNLTSSTQDIKKFNKFKYDSYRDLLIDINNENIDNVNNSSDNLVEMKKEEKKKSKYKLPGKAEELKSKANASFDEQNYVEAIEYYNLAIKLVPDSPILYGNRAASFMKRNWEGDTYAAMLDCYTALSLDVMHLKSHFRLAKCLYELKWYQEADEVIEIFVKRFPDYAESQACENLVNEIKTALDNIKKNEEKQKKTAAAKVASNSLKESKRKKPSSNTLSKFLNNHSNNNHTNGHENETDSEESENEEVSDESVDSNDDGNRFDEYDLSDYLNDEEENEENSSNTGESDTDLDNKLRQPNRKKRCDSNNNSATRSNWNNGFTNKKKIKKLNSLIKKYNKIKSESIDYKSRYCGHCNVATDIKEAAFMGENFICAGSDDCSFFIWDKKTTNVVRILKGDESIVNCLQPHPNTSMLATSGIDPVVRLWTPKFSSDENESIKTSSISSSEDERVVSDMKTAVLNNQLQMNSHPFEFLFLNLTQNPQNWDYEDDSSGNNQQQSVACRPS